jgi:hypothetical protein
MRRSRLTLVPNLTLEELDAYHDDVVASLRLFFSPAAPTFTARFAGLSLDEVYAELTERLDESEIRSAFALLTSLEASFRIDFDSRCRQRLKDDLSVFFRGVEKKRGDRVRLDEDILEGWKRHSSAGAFLISQLRGAFNFRHWLAHGRYWIPKLGRKYDFDFVYTMTSAIVSGFPFES